MYIYAYEWDIHNGSKLVRQEHHGPATKYIIYFIYKPQNTNAFITILDGKLDVQ